jgi:L-lysine exporter family protein LysE/ArgO
MFEEYSLSVILTGVITGLSLIVAIGSQNAFVLRQGLRRAHVLSVVLVCALSDAVLVCTGIFASAWITAAMPAFLPVMRWGGAVFLVVYGALSLRSAIRGGQTLSGEGDEAQSAFSAVVTCLMLTWLNPHVYLDTVVLLGAISTEFGEARSSFALGAVLASFLFFGALGYGARFLAPVFEKEIAWRYLDASICFVMWAIAAKLVFFA